LWHANLGNTLAKDGKLEEAILECKQAIQLNPDFAGAHRYLAAILYDQGKLVDALTELREAIRLKPDDDIARAYLAHVLTAQGKLIEAIAECRAAIRINPDSAAAHYNLGGALGKQGKLEEAIAEYRTAIRMKPDLAEAHNGLGSMLCDVKHEYVQAEAEFRVAVRLEPYEALVHANLGNALYHQGKLEAAVAEYRTAIGIKPDLACAHKNLAVALTDQGKPDQAVVEYTQAIRLTPNDASVHYGLGNALRDQRKLAEAIAAYHEAIRLKPDYHWQHNNLGNALKRQGKLDEAIAEYRTAIGIRPDCAEAHNNLGGALSDQGKLDEAIAEYRTAIRIKPDFAGAHSNLGTALWHQGKLDQAITEYRTAIRIKPDDAVVHSNLGIALRDQGKLDEAVAEHRTAIRLKPDYAEAHNDLGNALHDEGKLDEAVAEHRTAIRLKPDLANAHNSLGSVLKDQGKLDEAIAEHREAIRLKPDEYLPHRNLGRALRQLGDYAGSLAETRKAHELGSKRANWKEPSAEWVAEAERMAAMAPRLSAVLKGDDRPRDIAERLTFAQMAYDREHFAAAARLWAEALEADPARANHLGAAHRYNAACAAALAGSGKAVDHSPPDKAARSRFRTQAHDWLRADLALRGKQLRNGQPADRATARRALQHWKNDTELAGIRDAAALAALPPDEQRAWRALWTDVDAMLKHDEPQAQVALDAPVKARGKPLQPATKSGESSRIKAGDRPPQGNAAPVAVRGKQTDAVAADRAGSGPKPDTDKSADGAEATVSLAKRWPAIRKGEDRPRDTAERLSCAQMAYDRQHFALAARLWTEAFAADPKLGDDRDAGRLYDAAHAAILAADGKGKDDPPPGAQAKARLRAQALDWLKADLAVWAKVLASGSARDRMALIRTLVRWKIETDLVCIRDPAARKKLPAEEQKAWRTLWAGVDALLKPDDCWAHTHLGEALNAEGKRPEAAAEFRRAVRLAPYDGITCFGVGTAIRNQGFPDEGIELLSRAARWDNEHNDNLGLAIWRLGETLRSLGRYDEAVATFGRIRELRRAGPDDVRKADVEITLTEAQRRSDAAKAKLRSQALEWFKAELDSWSQALDKKSGQDRRSVVRVLEYWKVDRDLAGVRDGDALAKLPEADQKAWRAFWAEVDALLKKARGAGP
jgi:tetratricopeptide (TPR) repeat protein